MAKASRQLDTDRAARNRARRRLDARLVKARNDMTPGAISNRLAGRLKREARGTIHEAIEIARDNRSVVAGTLASLTLWFLRKPIMSKLAGKLKNGRNTKDAADDAS